MSIRRRTARVTRVVATLLTLAGLVSLGVLAANLAVLDGGTGGRVTGSVDCALVLGAGVRDDGSPSDVLRDRLDEALDLYRAGRVTRVIVSGDHQTARYDEPKAMRVYLEANGVVASRTKAFVDVTVGRAPRHVGPAVDLTGDGRVTAG